MPPPPNIRRQNVRPRAHTPHSNQVSLPRALSKLGYCSRTQALRLIEEGRVTVNGRIVRKENLRVNPNTEPIAVDGTIISASEKTYLMLHKPRGIVTTRHDPQGRATVYDHMPDDLPYVSPVGRLDKASEGLLFFTNDNIWAEYLLNPASQIAKTYHVKINLVADDDFLAALSRPIMDDGEILNAASVKPLRASANGCWLEIVLTEGRNRQVRRMIASQGAEVLRLVRVDIGGIMLGELGKGQSRALSPQEVRHLRGPTAPPPAPASKPRKDKGQESTCPLPQKAPKKWSPL